MRQGRLPLLFDLQESSGGSTRKKGFVPERSKRSRSTEPHQLPEVDETKEEYFYDLQQKIVFGRKLHILFDRSEKKPSSGEIKEKRGSGVLAIDCLTIEEEDAEDAQIDRIDLLSQDNESSSRSKISSTISKPLSKKLLVVDEMSADGEAKKRLKFDSTVG